MAAASPPVLAPERLTDLKSTQFFIGKGGFGTVYGRYSKSIGRWEAVKDMKKKRTTDDPAQIEIHNLTMFQHERIVKLIV